MARYFLTGNAFLDGRLIEASLESPKVITLPDDFPPSLTWTPLDQGAKAALDKLSKLKIDANPPEEAHRFKVKPIPKGSEKAPQAPTIDLKPGKPATKEQVEQAAFDQMIAKLDQPNGVPEVVVTPTKRPSDHEPRR